MAVADEVGLHIVGRYQDQNIVSTMHYRITAQTTGEDEILDQLCTGWNSACTSAWVARHIDTYELIGLKAFGKTGVNKRPGIFEVGQSGGVVGVETPSPVCRTITLYTADTNHWRRGRVMLSGSEHAMFDVDDGSVTASERTSLEALAALLLADITVGGDEFTPGLCAGTGIGGPYSFADFTSYLVRKTPACVRSRRIKGFSIG